MADLTIVLAGQFAASQTILTLLDGTSYSVPALKELVVTEMRFTNDTDTDQYILVEIGNVTDKATIFPQKDIPNRTLDGGFVFNGQTVIQTGDAIYGTGEVATGLWYYISALERDI